MFSLAMTSMPRSSTDPRFDAGMRVSAYGIASGGPLSRILKCATLTTTGNHLKLRAGISEKVDLSIRRQVQQRSLRRCRHRSRGRLDSSERAEAETLPDQLRDHVEPDESNGDGGGTGPRNWSVSPSNRWQGHVPSRTGVERGCVSGVSTPPACSGLVLLPTARTCNFVAPEIVWLSCILAAFRYLSRRDTSPQREASYLRG